MERNAFLPREYQLLDKHALIVEISQLGEIIGRLPDDEVLTSLKQEAEEARQALFDELGRRKADPESSLLFDAASQRHIEV